MVVADECLHTEATTNYASMGLTQTVSFRLLLVFLRDNRPP